MWRLILLLMMLPLSVPSTAQTRRALVIGIGQQEDKAWGKINGDKDVAYVEEMLKQADFNSENIRKLINRQATKTPRDGNMRSTSSARGIHTLS